MINVTKNQPAHRASNPFASTLVGLILTVAAGSVAAASIEGAVTNREGAPLYKVAVCLRTTETGDSCDRLRWTDQKGTYRFNGLKPDAGYTVEVFADTSAAARKFEQYKTYVWAPRRQEAAIAGKSESLELQPFVGKFNFSNFQRVITLTGADFPELSGIDLQSDYVALKVFLPSLREGEPPETIFLGRVTDVGQLVISASLPLAAREISYEIYSASLSFTGAITVAEG